MSTPQSMIYICSGVRLNPSYEHTIYFTSESKQLEYFAGKVVKTFSAYSFIRKSWNIKVNATMEEAKTWTYLYFRNGSGKYYFYFITNIEYVNDSTVDLTVEIDVMQTYHFDYSMLPCFVEREHASTDAIGDNTIEEGLEVGDMKVILQENLEQINELCVLVLSTFNPMNTNEQNTDTVLYATYNNVFSGLGIYAVQKENFEAWGNKLKLLDDYGKSEGIVAMWMYPKNLVQLKDGELWSDGVVCHAVHSVTNFNYNMSRNPTIDGYTPKNNKLFVYPYNFMYVSNNSGGAGVYRYERFENPLRCEFKCTGALSPEGAVTYFPLNYNGIILNYEEGLTLGGYPSCAWNQDIYKLWLAQNSNQQGLALLSGGAKILGGVIGTIATGGLGAVASGGMAVSGLSQVMGVLAQRSDKEIQPAQAKGTFSSNLNIVNGFQNFTMQRKCVTKEIAKIIDDFFDMYGYKTNRVKVPNRNVRANWTYTKTIGCHITGNLCTDDLTKIESIYNNGITFWKNGDSIANYTLANGIS